MKGLAGAGAALLGAGLRRSQSLGGGCLSQIAHIVLEDGREAIVRPAPLRKPRRPCSRRLPRAERRRRPCSRSAARCWCWRLCLRGGPLSGAWADLGRVAAMLHSARGASYGWAEDYAFGAVAIPNGWAGDWPLFWAERRLLTHCRHIAAGAGPARGSPRRGPSKPAARAPARGPAARRPVGRQRACGGQQGKRAHRPGLLLRSRRGRIAMLQMFDSPPRAFYEAYGAAKPATVSAL